MNDHENADWVDRSNAETLYHLERQGRSTPGLIPFIGAGVSTSFGFKDWKGLLIGACPPSLLGEVERLLGRNKYEQAAELILQALGPDAFQNMVTAAAGDRQLERFDFTAGTVSLLPQLASGPVITTNFDRIIERAFAANGAPFESVVSGPRPDLIVDALHGHRRVLIKLHGDWQDRVGRTFAKSDYDAHYGEAQPERKRELLTGAERLLFSSRSLLFIGASLGPDRTVKLLKKVQGQHAGVKHFAIMSAPGSRDAFEEKERHLRDCGVLPLWYRAATSSEHGQQVERLVAEIVERISVQTLAEASTAPRHGKSASKPVLPPAGPAAPAGLTAHFDRVERLIEAGRLTFFLGSAIHTRAKLMAQHFYSELARVFECEAMTDERFAVAQYIADRHGRETLDAEIRKQFSRAKLVPTHTHEFFAAWSHYQTSAGKPVPYPTIFTTNYDDILEHHLREARLPFHLVTYQADGPHKGLFFHESDREALRIIERPQNIRSLSEDAFVLVKLNGGLDRRGRIRESFVTTRLDYWDLASRIPEVLPDVLRRTLTRQPLLFLGHGLAAQDVESLVRFAHREHTGPRSWAVVHKQEGIEYWRQCGVEILDQDVDAYVNELRRRLLRGSKRRR
ncbi:MAG: SIR2 family protein [Variovorax sp.]|nr:SIR2 family protein [Variovorax sp.]